MSFDLSGVQVLCLVVMLGAVGWLVAVNRPRADERTVHQITSNLPFTLTGEAHDRLRRRVMRDLRSAGVVMGTAAGTLFVAAPLGASSVGLSVVASLFVVTVVWHLVAPFQFAAELVMRSAGVVPRGARVARSRVVGVTDYVRVVEVVLARIAGAAAFLLMASIVVGSIIEGAPLSSIVPVAALGVIVLAASLVVEAATHATVTQPRTASSGHALMSDDAVTSYGVRIAYQGQASVAYFCTTAIFLTNASDDGLPHPALSVGLYLLSSVAWMVLTITWRLDGSVRHFLVRLWGMPKGYVAPTQLAPVPTHATTPYRGGLR